MLDSYEYQLTLGYLTVTHNRSVLLYISQGMSINSGTMTVTYNTGRSPEHCRYWLDILTPYISSSQPICTGRMKDTV